MLSDQHQNADRKNRLKKKSKIKSISKKKMAPNTIHLFNKTLLYPSMNFAACHSCILIIKMIILIDIFSEINSVGSLK